MKIAIRKSEGSVPGGGFHYCLFPADLVAVFGPDGPAMFKAMGYLIKEVDGERAARLFTQAAGAMKHEVELAYIAEGMDSTP